MPYIQCFVCKTHIYRRPSRILRSERSFCSKKCRIDFLDVKYPERQKVCKQCNKPFTRNPAWSRRAKNSFCSESCQHKYMAQNSVGFISRGYKIISVNNKRFPEHRYLMEKHLKRKIKDNEHVHHINGIKNDNRIENLAILSESQHHSFHGEFMGKKIILSCKSCGVEKSKSSLYISIKYAGDYLRAKSSYMCQDCYYKNGGAYGRKQLFKR